MRRVCISVMSSQMFDDYEYNQWRFGVKRHDGYTVNEKMRELYAVIVLNLSDE